MIDRRDERVAGPRVEAGQQALVPRGPSTATAS